MAAAGEASKPRLGLLGGSVLDRQAYRKLLEEELGWKVSAEADFTAASVWLAMRSKPAVVLVDSDTASAAAVDAVQMITRLRPETRVLVVGAGVDPIHIQLWSRCRLHGYVVKDGGLEELRKALVLVADGRQHFSEGVREVVRPTRGAGKDGRPKLSRREAELLPLLARGLTLRDAARQMTVSYKTADSYRTSLLRKLGLRDRVELARYAIRERIIDP